MTTISGSVYLGMGTNLGERAANLLATARALEPAVRVLRVSRIYETPPWGFDQQPNFLNQVLETNTDLVPLDLLAYGKRLEVLLGRQPAVLWAAPDRYRYPAVRREDRRSAQSGCPPPCLAEQAIMLKPLADLAPDLRYPLLGKTIAELFADVDASGIHLMEE